MSTKGKLTFLKLGHTSKQKDSCTVVVMGGEEAGKTALIVRFLTRKYLPEYTHGSITSYERNVSLDDKTIPIRIIDTPGKETFVSLEKQDVLSSSDGYLVVYSIIDKKSFQKIKETLKMIHQETDGHPPPPPVALIGNKDDLIHLRSVSTVEGQKLALAYPGCSFFECSAAKDAENVEHAFNEFLREVLQTKDSKRHLSANCTLTVKSPNHRRNSAGNSTLSSWWKRPRSSSACENRQDRTFTM